MRMLFAVVVIYCMLGGCSYDCVRATPGISLVSFSVAETDSVVVRRYARNGGLSEKLDSFLLTPANSSYTYQNDTTEIRTSFGTDNGFLSRYDYEIYLPAVNRLFSISDIDEPSGSMNQGLSCNKVACMNSIRSYKVNGQNSDVGFQQSIYLAK